MTEPNALVREISNLSWPAAPYSTAHRPVQRRTLLLTGLVVTTGAWAAVHLPLHRTRALEVAGARLGVHAVAVDGTVGVDVLDRLLVAARRQATAIAGSNLSEGLAWAALRLSAAGTACPGVTTLLPEWLAAPAEPVRPSAGRAQLLELEGMTLQAAAASLLAQAQALPVPAGPDLSEQLAHLVTHAAAVALAAAAGTNRYQVPADFTLPDLTLLLDAAAGDLLPFPTGGPDPAWGSGWLDGDRPEPGEVNSR